MKAMMICGMAALAMGSMCSISAVEGDESEPVGGGTPVESNDESNDETQPNVEDNMDISSGASDTEAEAVGDDDNGDNSEAGDAASSDS